jgi:2-polyprenyl-6-hydroxyphenyl methylase/3-demethylubiquinone-9 3-methyltransferase
MALDSDISGYEYSSAACGCAHAYLLPAIDRWLGRLGVTPSQQRAFDLGCGNGAVAQWLTTKGFRVCGVDPSETGIREAQQAFPELDLRIGSAYEPLHESFGKFPLLVSLEVVEHVYSPRAYARCVYDLLEPGGVALISTPYHGYLKNLFLAITGKMDSHFTALWDHGHIKFWSPKTITALFEESGLRVIEISRIGRVPALAKSMLIVAQRLE